MTVRSLNQSLLDALMTAGLLQFGRFEGAPLRLNLALLPAYPQVLQAFVTALTPQLTGISRLVCTPAALPWGVGLALSTGIPLVYSQGGDAAPVYDLVGAYDIGHKSALLINTPDDLAGLSQFIQGAGSVGLEIEQVFGILDTGAVLDLAGISTQFCLDLMTAVTALAEQGRLPKAHVPLVQAWVNRHRD